MQNLRSPTLMAEEDFLALPETTEHVEFLDGEMILSPSPGVSHQSVLLQLSTELVSWARSQSPRPTVLQAPVDIRFAEGRILQPDAVVYLEPIQASQSGALTRIPDICIEVLSRNRHYDLFTKHVVYAAAGVQEYWLVDREKRLVERRSGESLSYRIEAEETLTSELLAGFELNVPELFED